MEKISKIFLICVYLIIVSNLLFAQSHVIHGVVHAFDSIPLIGAEVKIRSTKQVFYTDSLGNFVIHCNSKDKLQIEASGFSKQKVKITENIKVVAVNLKLASGDEKRNEEIRKYAIGYGYVSEQDKTTATAGLSKNEASFSRYADMYDLIRGQLAGVEVTNGEVIVRGVSSFNSSSAALIVVDGVIMESDVLRTISPVQVKDIHVIKDGSAAVYGSRGANGVVIIETRKGGDEMR